MSTMDSECDLSINSSDPLLIAHYYLDYNRNIVTIGIPIVVLLGLVGNLSFLFVICRLNYMRNLTNLFLANLAFADSIVLIAASVQYFYSYTYSAPLDVSLIGYTFRTPIGCSLPNLLNYSFYFASIWFIILVATERYLAICHPLRHIVIKGKGRAFRLVVATWLLSFSMGVFAAPLAGIETICIDGASDGRLGKLPRTISRCKPLCLWCEKILSIIDSLQFFCALVSNTIMYAIIIYTLAKRIDSSRESGICSEHGRVRNRANRNNVARMLIINAFLFFICVSPFMVINLNNIFNDESDIRYTQAFSWIGRMAYLLNSALNPYLYSATNPRYRRAICEAFGLVPKSKFNLNLNQPATVATTQRANTSRRSSGNVKYEMTRVKCSDCKSSKHGD